MYHMYDICDCKHQIYKTQTYRKKGKMMDLWKCWWKLVIQLRPACARQRTFMWMCVVLVGLSIRTELLGVTSFIRCLGLCECCYDRLLDFFHSAALNIRTLTNQWTTLVLDSHPAPLRCNDRLVLCADGIKVAKSGKKMPAVKHLHQESESNTKPEFIMGHSCQAISILVTGLRSIVALPLVARIHEGLIFSNRDSRTLLDRMILLLEDLPIEQPFYFLADAYYASGKTIRPLLARGNHLVTRVRSNAVGFKPAPVAAIKRPGRPKKYGEKLHLGALFDESEKMETVKSPLYGEQNVDICIRAMDLLWRPVGIMVRFVLVAHPIRGKRILMTTDLTLLPVKVIELYGYRFKIELTFKHALHVVGSFLYHFWMRDMTPLARNAGTQYLHRSSQQYRDQIRRKIDAYHRFIQLGLIAQGLMQMLATTLPNAVWRSFRSWLRTVRPGVCPSELVVSIALRNSLPEFLAGSSCNPIFKKFLGKRIDPSRAEGLRLAA